MRRALGAGLALVIAARTGAVRADPRAPQVDPIRAQREDAALLERERTGLDRDARAPAPGPIASDGPAPVPRTPDVRPEGTTTMVTDPRKVATGGILLGVAAVSALSSLAVLPLDTPLAGDNQDTYQTLFKVLVATAAVSGTAGIVFLVTSRSRVRVAPAITPRSAGLSISGEL
jgi:hypothetical protein